MVNSQYVYWVIKESRNNPSGVFLQRKRLIILATKLHSGFAFQLKLMLHHVLWSQSHSSLLILYNIYGFSRINIIQFYWRLPTTRSHYAGFELAITSLGPMYCQCGIRMHNLKQCSLEVELAWIEHPHMYLRVLHPHTLWLWYLSSVI